MLPEPQRQPASCDERTVRTLVPLLVRQKLRTPPLAVVLGHRSVNRTTVPEAPVDEDGNLRRPEHDVGTKSLIREWLSIDPEPKTPAMKQRADFELGPGVSASLALQPRARRRVERRWPLGGHARLRHPSAPASTQSPATYPSGIGTASPIHFASWALDEGRSGYGWKS